MGLRGPRPSDQRLAQPVGVMDIIEAVAPLDAQPAMIRRTVATVHVEDLVVLDIERQKTPDAAIGAGRLDLLVRLDEADVAGRHERARGAGLDALPAAHAGATAHGIVEIEDDPGMRTPKGIADHVIDLLLAAGAHAACALDAGVEVDGDGGVGEVRRRLLAPGEARGADLQPVRPAVQLRARGVGRAPRVRHVREQ